VAAPTAGLHFTPEVLARQIEALAMDPVALNNAAARYGKPIIVAETAFPWSSNCPAAWTNSLFGFPPTPGGQVSFLATVAQIVKSLPNKLGTGILYWGAEYQAVGGVNEAGFDTASFFDSNGNGGGCRL